MVDWARAAGFEVVCAGKGTKYLPAYHASTPETVWTHYGCRRPRTAAGGMNPQMFNSFLDGTKSAIEMAAVANATGLVPQSRRPRLPALRRRRPAAHAATAKAGGASCSHGRPGRGGLQPGARRPAGVPRPALGRLCHLRGDAANRDYVERCFKEYGLVTDPSGRYAAMYKPYHLIGLELGITVAIGRLRARRPGRRGLGWATWWRPPSATSPRAKCSTARAATRSMAS
jgi:hypothetical protein